jgi:hypothetical protein
MEQGRARATSPSTPRSNSAKSGCAHGSQPNLSSGNYISFMSSMQHLQTITAQPLETEPITQKSEVERYLEMGPLPPATNILDWWASQDHEEGLPNLARMARQFLGTPATSASAERLFSIAGRIYDDLRHSLSSEMLQEIMWARINTGMRGMSPQDDMVVEGGQAGTAES